MPTDPAVLQQLRDGRAGLAAEVERLSAAIVDLDSAIARLDDSTSRPVTAPIASTPPPSAGSPDRARSRPTGRTRQRGARRTTRPAGHAATETGSKSIRLRVLEMLAAEDREFEVAEIIDRIRAAGIQAHDDAVRSITIKLMKDGQVERISRGRYRLLRGAAPDGDQSAEPELLTPPALPPAAGVEPPGPPQPPPPISHTPPLDLAQPWQRPSA